MSGAGHLAAHVVHRFGTLTCLEPSRGRQDNGNFESQMASVEAREGPGCIRQAVERRGCAASRDLQESGSAGRARRSSERRSLSWEASSV